MKLYEINFELEQLLNSIYRFAEENDGVVPEDSDNYLNQLQMEREIKILDIARYIKSLKAESEAIKKESDNLLKRYKTCKNMAYRLKQYLLMNIPTGEKFKDNNTIINWRKSEAVYIINESDIPTEYFKIEKTPMLSIIKNDLKKGNIITGVKLEQHNNLIIK